MNSLRRALAVTAAPILVAAAVAAGSTVAAGTATAAPAAVSAAAAGLGAAALGSAQRPVRIMPLGDSITDGYRQVPDSYRRNLYGYLTAAGVRVDYVGSASRGTGRDNDHEGHSGWRIRDVQAEIAGWLRDSDPDIVLLNIGTNDIGFADDIRPAPRRLATLIDTILAQSPAVRIVVAEVGVPPRTAEPGWTPLSARPGWTGLPAQRVLQGQRMPAYNAAVPGIVARRGPRVSLVDLSGISPRHTDDALHPDATGFRQQAYQWYNALRPLFPDGATWPILTDPFPRPTVRVAASARAAGHGSSVTVTGRLSGLLGYGELAGQPAQLQWRRAGAFTWTVLRSGVTGSSGTLATSMKVTAIGDLAFRVTGGRGQGRQSPPVRVMVTDLPPVADGIIVTDQRGADGAVKRLTSGS
jgi:lysophospholipase L1-like esterase